VRAVPDVSGRSSRGGPKKERKKRKTPGGKKPECGWRQHLSYPDADERVKKGGKNQKKRRGGEKERRTGRIPAYFSI